MTDILGWSVVAGCYPMYSAQHYSWYYMQVGTIPHLAAVITENVSRHCQWLPGRGDWILALATSHNIVFSPSPENIEIELCTITEKPINTIAGSGQRARPLRHHLGRPHPASSGLGPGAGSSTLVCSFQPWCIPRGSRCWPKAWGHCHPSGRPGLNSRLLCLTRLKPSLLWHLERETADARCLPAFHRQTNKTKHEK